MKKVMSEKDFRGLQDLGIDKVIMYEEERTTKMPDKMYQHLSQEFELAHEDWIIKGMWVVRLEVLPILNNL